MFSLRRQAVRDALRVGVIGCGFVARRHHLPALDALPQTSLAALADVDEHALARAGAGRRVRLHPDPLALIEDDSVEAIAVCTPPATHHDLASAALERGKAVLIEKPVTLTLDECDQLLDRARATGVTVGVSFPYRWHRLVRDARAIVGAGTLGPVGLVQTAFTFGSHRRPGGAAGWRDAPNAGAGVLMEVGVHHFDLWRFLLVGEVEAVRAVVTDGLTAAAVTARGPGGAVLSGALADSAGDNHELVVYGREATLRVRADRYDGLELVPSGRLPGDPSLRLARSVARVRQLPRAFSPRGVKGDLPAAFEGRWRDFAAAVRDGRQPEADLEDGRRALEVALAAVTAGAEEEPIPT